MVMPATVWRGRLAFGLVSIPVRLYPAARRQRIQFRHVHRRVAEQPEPQPDIQMEPEYSSKAGRGKRLAPEPIQDGSAPAGQVGPVHNLPVGAERTPVQANEILKGYEYEPHRYVVLDRHELAGLRPRTSDELELVEFVRLADIDPVYLDMSYYAAPDPGGEKPYAVLFEALRDTGYAALGTFAMHGRENTACIRPRTDALMLHTLFYAREIRPGDEYHVVPGAVTPKELELASRFIEARSGTWDPGKFRDTHEERLRAVLDARARRELAPAAEAEPHARAGVIDILDALRRSLETVRKPAAAERRSKPERTRRAH